VHGVDHADEVDVEGIGEGLNPEIRAQRADARIGDDDVELAEFGYGIGEFARDGGPVTHVDLGGIGLATGLLDFETGLFEVP
jgi:hypothetical protein